MNTSDLRWGIGKRGREGGKEREARGKEGRGEKEGRREGEEKKTNKEVTRYLDLYFLPEKVLLLRSSQGMQCRPLPLQLKVV